MSEQSNEEIRVKCAELMGWSLCQCPCGCRRDRWSREGDAVGVSEHSLPNFPVSMDAALTLCDRLREEGWEAVLTGKSMKTIWYVEFKKYLWGSEVCHRATDPSLPRAIALAFLKAKESK